MLVGLLLCGVAACRSPHDLDGDRFTPDEGDCDESDPSVNPSEDDVVGDGVDANCDGTDLPSVSLEEIAQGIVYSTLGYHNLGYNVACGPDVDGNGVGDLAFNSATFQVAMAPVSDGSVYRTNGPVRGAVDEREIEGWRIQTGDEVMGFAGGTNLALLAPPFRPGLAIPELHGKGSNRVRGGSSPCRLLRRGYAGPSGRRARVGWNGL